MFTIFLPLQTPYQSLALYWVHYDSAHQCILSPPRKHVCLSVYVGFLIRALHLVHSSRHLTCTTSPHWNNAAPPLNAATSVLTSRWLLEHLKSEKSHHYSPCSEWSLDRAASCLKMTPTLQIALPSTTALIILSLSSHCICHKLPYYGIVGWPILSKFDIRSRRVDLV